MNSPRRVVVVGNSGSGKTTFANRLARQLGCRHIELDALHWEPNWMEAPTDVFRDRVTHALDADTWIVDGNYSQARDLVWARADTVVWLDYSLPTILWRVVIRTCRRVLTRAELWSGNRESLRTTFFSRDSIILWALTTHKRRKKEYALLSQSPAYAHLTFIHLTSPRDAETLLRELTPR